MATPESMSSQGSCGGPSDCVRSLAHHCSQLSFCSKRTVKRHRRPVASQGAGDFDQRLVRRVIACKSFEDVNRRITGCSGVCNLCVSAFLSSRCHEVISHDANRERLGAHVGISRDLASYHRGCSPNSRRLRNQMRETMSESGLTTCSRGLLWVDVDRDFTH